jgi:hypothetical protein
MSLSRIERVQTPLVVIFLTASGLANAQLRFHRLGLVLNLGHIYESSQAAASEQQTGNARTVPLIVALGACVGDVPRSWI